MSLMTSLVARFTPVTESTVGRYGLAVLFAVGAVSLRMALEHVAPVSEAPYFVGVVGVALSAYFGGWGPGALTTLTIVVLVQMMHVLPSAGGWRELDTSHALHALGFGGESVVMAFLIASLVRVRREGRMRGSHRDLRDAAIQALVTARSDADAINETLSTIASKFRASAAIAWWIEDGQAIARATYLSEHLELDDGADALAAAQGLADRALTGQVAPTEAVRKSIESAHAGVASTDEGPRAIRHVLTIPIVPGHALRSDPAMVVELRRSLPFASDRCTRESLREVGAEIGQALWNRISEERVHHLSQRLAERAQELQAVLDTSPIGIAVSLDDRCEQLVLNAAGESMLGSRLRASSIEAPASLDPIERTILAPLQQPMRSSMKAAQSVGPVEFEALQPDGTVRSVYEYASPLVDDEGRVRGCVAAFVDITSLRVAEHTVRDRERAFRRSFESAGVGKAQVSLATGRLEMVNRRLCGMLGRSVAELEHSMFVDVLDPADQERARAMLQRLADGTDLESSDEFRLMPRDGSTIYASTSMTVSSDEGSQPAQVIVVLQDITARTLAERELDRYRTKLEEIVAERTLLLEESHRQLRLSERMAALGTLSAGLGHDMGNLLLPVRLRLEAIALKGIPASIAEDVTAIGTCTEYLQRLANGLRLLSLDPERSGPNDVTNMLDWWADVESFLKHCLPHGVELERRFDSDLPLVSVSRHRLTQAVFNLVQNAGDALAGRCGGRVRITVRNLPSAASVQLIVSDNGPGMTPEIRARCLEPFFTSKPRGISTGLGLSLVHGIVQQSGGTIDIETELGYGTRFTLAFPHAPQRASPIATVPNTPPIRAIVTIADPRLQSYALAVGRTIGCEIDAPLGVFNTLDQRGCIWIASSDTCGPSEIAQFLASGPHRKLVILGDSPEGTVTRIDVQWLSHPTPSLIRRVFRESVADLITAIDGDGIGAND